MMAVCTENEVKSNVKIENIESNEEAEVRHNDVVVKEESDEDQEEEFFKAIQKQNEEELGKNEANKDLPTSIKEAPKLIKKTLENANDKVESKQNGQSSKKDDLEDNGKEGNGGSMDVPQSVAVSESKLREERANQLDVLLNRASEYSKFIANDIEELQTSMADRAAAASAEETEGVEDFKKKKRKKGKDSSSSKKLKKNNGEKALADAQNKHSDSLRVGSKPIFIQPRNLAKGCILKDYQLEGVRWMSSLYENGVSGILADEMGLGKTIQVISLIAHLRTMDVHGPFIVVAPLATLPNWIREFEKWLPELPVVRFHGNAQARTHMLSGPLNFRKRRNLDFPVIVTSYEIAIRDQKRLSKIGEFTYLVVDEGQRLKNHRCTLIGSLKQIPASNRLLLSGTPIQNNLDELWSLLNFVNPQIFDDLSVFQSWFGFRDIGQRGKQYSTSESDIMEEQRKNRTVSKLHEILRPFLLRRIKRDVLSDLPPKKEVVVYAGMSKLQSGYSDLIEKGVLRDTLLNQGIEGAHGLSQINKQMNHRKNSNHPFLFGEPIDPASGNHVGSVYPHLLVRASGKFALLDRILSRLFIDKHQVLIFSQMTEVLNVMEDYLFYKKWNYCRIDGNTKIDERQRQMDLFNAEKTGGKDGCRNDSDNRIFVFLLSTRAGGLGINLASADTCIIFDSDWNPHQDSQAMDRCHRIGQNRPVAVYRLLTTGSVDIEMMEKQISKKKLERMAIVGGDFRKAGKRSIKGKFDSEVLSSLLEDDIKDLQAKTADVEDIKISEEEFDLILDRKKLFAEGADAVPTEGKMYDILDAAGNDGGMLGSMNA